MFSQEIKSYKVTDLLHIYYGLQKCFHDSFMVVVASVSVSAKPSVLH